ncbi:MAG TPA: M50 family metallopeptidase, partial [Coriobacteriia bacterium]|nr:M50 family metallopeptidase [Coriobacteriia bacterium]
SEGLAALFWGVVTFSILIVIHEGGHFLAARAFGIKVHEFMIGLPGPALRLKGKKTTYGITMVPLGGYVRIAGMEPGAEDPALGPALAALTRRGRATAFAIAEDTGVSEEDADRTLMTLVDWGAATLAEDDEYTFVSEHAFEAAEDPSLLDRARSITYRSLKLWQRVVLLSAGVFLNLMTAVLVFSIVVSIYGVYSTKISAVGKDSAAARAGLKVGDRITRVDGHRIGTWQKLMDTVAGYDPGYALKVTFMRGEQEITVIAKLGKNPDTGHGMLGVSPSIEKPSPWRALIESISYIGLTFGAILKFFDPRFAREAMKGAASVIGASYMAADAARTSALSYASLVAMLSLSLGVINIFPVPPLDGGKVLLEFVEALRGRPLPRKVSLGLSAAGAILLFSLIAVLMYADVIRYIVK